MRTEFPARVKVAAYERSGERPYNQFGGQFRLPNGATLAQRHERRTDRSGGADACWPWLARLNAKGYGTLSGMLAHRIAYETSKGPIPTGLYVLHNCDNRKCQNPAHLRVGTQLDNVRDMHERGRDRKVFGSAHRNAKLTEAQVREMRASPLNRADLSRQFRVHWDTVDAIVSGRTWKHVK